jgi:predicted amidohydrolase YtcJ
MTSATVDTVLVSRRIVTMRAGEDEVLDGGVAVAGERIERLVGRDEIEALAAAGAQVIDVGERSLLPGFVDPHAHVEVACRASHGTVDVRTPEVACVSDLQDRLAEALPDAERTGWVIGQGNLFYDRKLREGRLPTRKELDAVSRTVPIALRAGGHVTVLNTAALERAGIDKDYRPPEHSITGKPIVERCQCHDEPTGVVKEMDNLLPFPLEDRDTISDALETGMRELFTANGVTSVGEISETLDGIGCMDRLAIAGRLPARVRLYLWAPGTMDLDQACDWRSHFSLASPSSRLGVGGVKLFSDGGYSAASAAVNADYVHVEHPHSGSIALTADQVEEAVGLTRDAGLQLAIHANGDRAQEWLCETIASRSGRSEVANRIRIEHAGNFRPQEKTSDAWRQAGILPVPQPVFLYTFGDYFVDYLGDYGAQGRFPFRTLLDEGWPLSSSSDVWIGSEREATNPMFAVWCSVARTSYAGRRIDPEQALTVDEALRLSTLGAAEAMGEAAEKGSLEPGKLADVVALDRDVHRVAVDDLRGVKVDLTMVGGDVVHRREGGLPA